MNDSHSSGEPSADALALIRRLEECQRATCQACGRPLCAHQVLASIALGSGRAPRCLECLAEALDQPVPQLVESVRGYFQGRECFRAACDWARRRQRESNSCERCCAMADCANLERQEDW